MAYMTPFTPSGKGASTICPGIRSRKASFRDHAQQAQRNAVEHGLARRDSTLRVHQAGGVKTDTSGDGGHGVVGRQLLTWSKVAGAMYSITGEGATSITLAGAA